jgi:hypothetical protein
MPTVNLYLPAKNDFYSNLSKTSKLTELCLAVLVKMFN